MKPSRRRGAEQQTILWSDGRGYRLGPDPITLPLEAHCAADIDGDRWLHPARELARIAGGDCVRRQRGAFVYDVSFSRPLFRTGIHQTIRVTPPMEAGVVNHIWSVEEIGACYTERVRRENYRAALVPDHVERLAPCRGEATR